MTYWKDNHSIEFQEYIDSPNLSSASLDGSDPESETVVESVDIKQDCHSRFNEDFIPNGRIPNEVDKNDIQFLPNNLVLKSNEPASFTKIHSIQTSNAKSEKEEKYGYENENEPEEAAAQAAIQDSGSLKKSGISFEEPPPTLDASFASDVSFLSLSQVPSRSPSASVLSEEDILFKKREIKCKNIRRSKILTKGSVSPEEKKERSQAEDKHKRNRYPKNWLEYKEMKLNPKRDAVLKSKELKSFEVKKFDFKRYFNFEKRPIEADHYKYQNINGNYDNLPFQYLRYTAAKPQILYSTNHMHTSPTPLNREQIFAIIPKERKSIIEKLWKYSRLEPVNRATTAKPWFPKKWKNLDNSEAKLLEASVGLSFLQSYSDDEENVDQVPLTVVDVSEEIQPPEKTPDNLEGIITISRSKSRWDPASPEKAESEPVIDDIRTPPLATPQRNDKEDGEVSEEEHTPQTPKLPTQVSEEVSKEETVDIDLEEYERTKEELLKLEEVLKSSTSYLEELNAKESKQPEVKKKEKKKKRKKVAVVKVSKRKDPKKKAKKKKKKEEPAENLEEVSVEETPKKKKRKPDKPKDKKRKIKKKKKSVKPESHSKEKRKKKKKQTDKSRRRTISGESDLKGHKPEGDEYEDDIKFFADRLDAERELKGKSKHKTKGVNISVDELTVTKTEDKPSKRKSSESDGVRSKSRDKENCKREEEKSSKRKSSESDGVRSKSRDKESSKKEQVKVDLLKMNEKYLKEQKKKEELTPKEKTRDSRSLSSEKGKGKLKPEQSNSLEKGSQKSEELIIVPKIVEETQPDCEPLKEKRKRARTESNSEESTEKKAKSAEELTEIVLPEEISIKQEKHLIQKTNSWEESDEEQIEIDPDMEIPLNVTHVARKEIKIEKDVFDIEEPPSKAKAVEERVEQPDLRLHLLEIKSRKSETSGLEANVLTPKKKKKRRWDILSPAIISEPAKDVVTLEDEYEEFMKSVTVKTEEETNNTKSVVIDSSSESSVPYLEDFPPIKSLQDVVPIPLPALNSDEIKLVFVPPKVDTLPPLSEEIKVVSEPPPKVEAMLPSSRREEINPAETTLLPLEREEIKLVFVPPPKVETLPPLNSEEMNLGPVPPPNAESGVEFHHLHKIKTSPSLKSVIEFKPVPVPPPKVEAPSQPRADEYKPAPLPSPKLEAVLDLNKPLINLSLSANVTQNITFSLATSMPSISAPITSTIDVSKPKVEISALPAETYYVPNAYFAPEIFQLPPPPPPPPPEEPNSKLSFSSLALTSKKLLDNSLLNFEDSDEDEVRKLEQAKRKRLEAIMQENQRDTDKEQARLDHIINRIQEKADKEMDRYRRASPRRSSTSSRFRDSSPRRGDRRGRRESPVRRRGPSPRRRSPGRKRSPKRLSPRRRSPDTKKKASGRRSVSPKGRRSVSPKRRRTAVSPRKRRGSSSPKRKRSQSPRKSNQRLEVDKVKHEDSKKSRELSPLRRSVPDSTISDDQLSRENLLRFAEPERLNFEPPESLKQAPLRINRAMGYNEPRATSPKPISTITTPFYHNTDSYHEGEASLVESPSKRNIPPTLRTVENQSMYRQVGNIMQIVPMEQENLNEMPAPTPLGKNEPELEQPWYQQFDNSKPAIPHLPEPRPQILQVGNFLEVVPTEIISGPAMLQKIKTEIVDDTWPEQQPSSSEKPSAEATMLQKEAERREEREKRRLERERRRVEKEKRRQEKEKIKEATTEDMIRKALEEEEEEELEKVENERLDSVKSEIVQWPPLSLLVHHTVNRDAGKSILLNSGSRLYEIVHVAKKIRKVVQFADGVRPGYGTSPSAGEELSSPPPPKRKLPKEKRYKKLKFHKKKNLKKKKAKIHKKSLVESDSDDNLPPPSPPPGSPPPHLYPPRVKPTVINTVPTLPSAYLASIMQTVQQLQTTPQPQLNIFRPSPSPVNLLMPPPPALSHVPPTSHVQSPSVQSTHLPSSHVPTPHVPPPHLQSSHVPPPRLQSPQANTVHTGQSPQGPYPHHTGLHTQSTHVPPPHLQSAHVPPPQSQSPHVPPGHLQSSHGTTAARGQSPQGGPYSHHIGLHTQSTHVPPPQSQSPHVPPGHLQSPHGTTAPRGQSPQGPYSHHIGLHTQSTHVPPPQPQSPHLPPAHLQNPHGTTVHTGRSPQGPYPPHIGLHTQSTHVPPPPPQSPHVPPGHLQSHHGTTVHTGRSPQGPYTHHLGLHTQSTHVPPPQPQNPHVPPGHLQSSHANSVHTGRSPQGPYPHHHGLNTQSTHVPPPQPQNPHVPPPHLRNPHGAPSHLQSSHGPHQHLQNHHGPPPRLQSSHGTSMHTGQSPQGHYHHHTGLPRPRSPVLRGSIKTSRWSSAENSRW